MFEEDGGAFCLFNATLFAFKTKGEGLYANQKLSIALKQNKFVASKLLSEKLKYTQTDSYGYGDGGEANYYTTFAYFIWQDTYGALRG